MKHVSPVAKVRGDDQDIVDGDRRERDAGDA
jgi:hypothetical protein